MEGFGQTETTLTLGTFPWMEPKPGSMGVPNPQYDIDLLTPDGVRQKTVNRDRLSSVRLKASRWVCSKSIIGRPN